MVAGEMPTLPTTRTPPSPNNLPRHRGGGVAPARGRRLARVLGLAGLAALAGCTAAPAPRQAPPPPQALRAPPPAGTVADAPDGLYSGHAVLLDTRGDCNAGGTGQLLVADGQAHFRDARNGQLDGALGPDGAVDLSAGQRHLLGSVRGGAFEGTISGGVCDYRLAFRRASSAAAVEVAGFVPSRPDPEAVARGMAAFDARRPGQAAERWQAAALAGDSKAALFLGAMYDTGQGVGQDYAQALAWYRRAAEAGNATGMFNVGVMYDAGRGVARDPSEAAHWYARAAAKGYGRAEYDLALLYQAGTGVPRDPERARQLFRRAAQHGIAAARRGAPPADTEREAGS